MKYASITLLILAVMGGIGFAEYQAQRGRVADRKCAALCVKHGYGAGTAVSTAGIFDLDIPTECECTTTAFVSVP